MKDTLIYILGGFIALAMVAVILILMFFVPDQVELLNQSVTALIAAFTFVVGYFFGSSQGSADKNKIIGK